MEQGKVVSNWRLWSAEEIAVIERTKAGEITRWQCYNQIQRSRNEIDKRLRTGKHIEVKGVMQEPAWVPANDPGLGTDERTMWGVGARDGSARLLERLREVHGCGYCG